MNIVVQGSKIVLTEISDQWGEESCTFIGRPALFRWVEQRFPKANYEGKEDEWEVIMQRFHEA